MIKILATITFLSTLLVSPVFAVTPTPTASDSANVATSSSTSVQDELKERIKNVVTDKVKQTEEQINRQLDSNNNLLIGYQGQIQNIKQGVIDLSVDNSFIQITTSTATAIVKDSQNIKLESLALKNTIIVIGNQTSAGVLNAKRIVAVNQTADNYSKQIGVATITKVDTKDETLTLNWKNSPTKAQLGKKIKTKITDFQVNNQLFFVLYIPNDSKLTPSLIQYQVLP